MKLGPVLTWTGPEANLPVMCGLGPNRTLLMTENPEIISPKRGRPLVFEAFLDRYLGIFHNNKNPSL